MSETSFNTSAEPCIAITEIAPLLCRFRVRGGHKESSTSSDILIGKIVCAVGVVMGIVHDDCFSINQWRVRKKIMHNHASHLGEMRLNILQGFALFFLIKGT